MKQVMALAQKFMKKKLPQFNIGDSVDVHFKIKEENKMRVQIYSGIVIARRGSDLGETFTVRHVSYGEGVEKVFPIHSPLLEKVVVKKKGEVQRAKLYFLRGKKGKKAVKVKEKVAQKEA
ncbi:MAG: 50S ribosomal protein L19 [Candidatus Omnitrophica bacterium]|nr:50S ribosomal protein L19 [Candidatus Omnitrophota bacterium]